MNQKLKNVFGNAAWITFALSPVPMVGGAYLYSEAHPHTTCIGIVNGDSNNVAIIDIEGPPGDCDKVVTQMLRDSGYTI